VGGALALAVTVGGASASALEGLGESLRTRDATIREARALSAQARLSAWVVGAAPVAYLGFVGLADPGAVDTLLTTTAGRACLVAGLVLEGLAALWMRALLRSTA
jgi:tight adherence protein B